MKPTGGNTILRYTSAHPRHLLNKLPISQFMRVMRICSEPDVCQTHIDLMSQRFLQRCYPQSMVDQALIRAKDRFLHCQQRNTSIPFIQTYNNVYGGKIIGPFKRRFQRHCSDIPTAVTKALNNEDLDDTKPVAVHFMKHKDQVHELRGAVIDHIRVHPRGGNRENMLLCREALWIFTLDTLAPRGLNTSLSHTCFLNDG